MVSSSGSARHYVQFYEDESFLYEVVADFLETGVQAREPAIVIATREPPRRILARAEGARRRRRSRERGAAI